MKSKRDVMRKGEKITLEEKESGIRRVFTIDGKDGVGASSISYFASCGTYSGRLKEFYPCEELCGSGVKIDRQKDNQLYWICEETEDKEAFEKMQDAYIDAYRTLKEANHEAKVRSKKGRSLVSTFIPAFEIYHGCGENGSVYIWTPNNDGDDETFEQYLKTVHKHPARHSLNTLFEIFQTLYNLTECVKVLHSIGLIHGDLKPANFGLPMRDERYLTEQVQLFDINSLYSVYSKFTTFSGTRGYCAPEVLNKKISNQSDLYSIGAILFHALAISTEKDIPADLYPADGLYDEKYYDRLDEIVKHSDLIRFNPITANLRFCNEVVAILKSCLTKDTRARVESCDILKEDLRRICGRMLPYSFRDKLDLSEQADAAKKVLEQYNDADATFALQSLLFEHPLYEKAKDDVIKVCVIGFGVYGQKFLDLCLQAGQVRSKKLEVTVVTQDKEAYKEEYLSGRPALREFFEVDGEGDCSDTNYGKVIFVTPQDACDDGRYAEGFSKTNMSYNKRLVEALMFNKYDAHYIFIALGEDKLNEAVAKACVRFAEDMEMVDPYTVAYACSTDKTQKKLVPVNVVAKATENKSYKTIERMAFNVHLAWSSPLKMNINLRKLKKEFRENAYNRDASVACVLAIKNVFHACGIKWEDSSPEAILRMSGEYKTFIDKNKEVFADLVSIEHRRWVTEKITLGWARRTELTDCLNGSIPDKVRKLHPCIVKSRADFLLEELYMECHTKKWFKDRWNEPWRDDARLDELDTLSLELHRVFFAQAQEIRRTYSPDGEDAFRIRRIIGDHKELMLAFNRWMHCLKRIWNTDDSQTRFYDSFKDTFTGKLKTFAKSENNADPTHILSKPVLDEVLRCVKNIDAKATILIAAFRMRDYKSTDKDLIQSIPFILTRREDHRLFVPLMTGSNTAVFDNVSVATVVNPDQIVYGVMLRNADDIRDAEEALKCILPYMNDKDIRSKLKIALFYRKSSDNIGARIPQLAESIKARDSKRIRQVMVFPLEKESDIARIIADNIKADAYEDNDTYLAGLLNGAGFYENVPFYSFNSAKKEFCTSESGAWLRYIKSDQFITADDIMAFNSSKGEMQAAPEYPEYKELWGLYARDPDTWKALCSMLKNYAYKQDRLAKFKLPPNTNGTIEELQLVVPDQLRDSCRHILSCLRDAKVIDEQSTVEYKTTGSCCVKVFANRATCEKVKSLFKDPYKLTSVKDIEVRDTKSTLEIVFDDLVVTELDMSACNKESACKQLLKDLEKWGLIHHLDTEVTSANTDNTANANNTANKKVSFVYSAKESKSLLTSEGRLLEIYVYHKLLESGFSNVVSSYEIQWDNSDVKSEIDCIATLGFRSVIIECKARKKLDQDIYQKLFSNSSKFGINMVRVMIAHTNEDGTHQNHSAADRENNKMQRERGEKMDIVTVSNTDHIRNIDVTLRQIFNGNYRAQNGGIV